MGERSGTSTALELTWERDPLLQQGPGATGAGLRILIDQENGSRATHLSPRPECPARQGSVTTWMQCLMGSCALLVSAITAFSSRFGSLSYVHCLYCHGLPNMPSSFPP